MRLFVKTVKLGGDGLLDAFRLLPDSLGDQGQTAAEAVDLVQQVHDRFQSLIVAGQDFAQLDQKFDPRHVDVGEAGGSPARSGRTMPRKIQRSSRTAVAES